MATKLRQSAYRRAGVWQYYPLYDGDAIFIYGLDRSNGVRAVWGYSYEGKMHRNVLRKDKRRGKYYFLAEGFPVFLEDCYHPIM